MKTLTSITPRTKAWAHPKRHPNSTINHSKYHIPTSGAANRLYLLTSSFGAHSESGCQVYVSGQHRYDGAYWP